MALAAQICAGIVPVYVLHFFHKKIRNLRIQGRMQFFEKMSQKALNRVLTLPDYSI